MLMPKDFEPVLSNHLPSLAVFIFLVIFSLCYYHIRLDSQDNFLCYTENIVISQHRY